MPSRPVRLVSNGGMPVRVVTDGLSDPVRVVTDGPSDPVRVVTGGPSDPVRVISGSLTPVASDPIGDGLRADAIAYWTMNEASGIRADSTGHGFNLSEYLTVPSVSGKIGNAVHFSDSTDDTGDLEYSGFTMDISTGFTFSGWIWTPGMTNNNTIGIIRCFAPAGGHSINLFLENDVDTNTQLFEGWNDSVGTPAIPLNQWNYFRFWKTAPDSLTAYLQVNHESISTVNSTTYVNPNGTLILNNISYVTDTDYYYLDECGLFGRALSDEEDAYLWNDGAGRTLFP